jgi:hypothetical protein
MSDPNVCDGRLRGDDPRGDDDHGVGHDDRGVQREIERDGVVHAMMTTTMPPALAFVSSQRDQRRKSMLTLWIHGHGWTIDRSTIRDVVD